MIRMDGTDTSLTRTSSLIAAVFLTAKAMTLVGTINKDMIALDMTSMLVVMFYLVCFCSR